MLNEVVLSVFGILGINNKFFHHIKLMVTGEDKPCGFLLNLSAILKRNGFLYLFADIPLQDG